MEPQLVGEETSDAHHEKVLFCLVLFVCAHVKALWFRLRKLFETSSVKYLTHLERPVEASARSGKRDKVRLDGMGGGSIPSL